MKKITTLAALVAATLLTTSCGTGSTASSILGGSTTQTTGSAASGILGGLTQSGGGILGNLLSSILGSTTTQQSLIGTWTYQQTSVKFESENVLSKIGGTIVSSKIESAMATQLTKIGFTAGRSTITFSQDGKYTIALGSKSYNGTYTYNQQTHIMTLKGAFGLTSLNATATVSAGTLYILFDADKLLTVATKIGSINNTLSSLLKNYNGIKLGWSMTK